METTFSSAWFLEAEPDLPILEFRARRRVVRRQRLVYLCGLVGWHFLRYGESVRKDASLLVGISLDRREDYDFLDWLRYQPEKWRAKEVYLFHVEKPYVLPLPTPVRETPSLAVFEGGALRCHLQGAECDRYLRGP